MKIHLGDEDRKIHSSRIGIDLLSKKISKTHDEADRENLDMSQVLQSTEKQSKLAESPLDNTLGFVKEV